MKIRAFFVFALTLCGIIFTLFPCKANNSAQYIQELLVRIQEQLEKDTETLPELIQEVEVYTQTCSDTISVAILHSMTAEMYQCYFNQNSFKISRRTQLTNYTPSDIREWSSNLFTKKIKQELTLSLQPAYLLQQTPISQYNLILEKGKDTPELRPTVYDFLIYRAIQIQPDIEWYKDLLAFRQNQPQMKALLFDELAYQKYKYEHNLISATTYQQLLDSLYTLYQKEPYGAEIRISQLHLLQNLKYQGDNAHQDSIMSAIYSLCKESIIQYPQYARTNIFKNELDEMEAPFLDVQVNNNVYPGKKLIFTTQYKNTPQLIVRIYKSLLNPINALGNKKEDAKSRGELIKEQIFNLSLPNTYTQYDTLLSLPMEQLGLYEYEITTPDKQISVSNQFSVSKLAVTTRNLKSANEVLITDLESGKPIKGVTIRYYKTFMGNNQIELQGEEQTNSFGLASFPVEENTMLVRPIFREDSSSIATYIYPYGRRLINENKKQIELSLFTDRGIYRPGQTIFFKGIAYIENTENPHVVSGHSYTIKFLDANHKLIDQKTFQTDEFGSFHGEFTIPTHTLNGHFTLKAGEERIDVLVEEYKRPTFQINLFPLKEEVSFGQTVQIKGNASTFSGLPIQKGQIHWTISRRSFWGRSYLPVIPNGYKLYRNQQVANGTTQVDSKGNFSINFTPENILPHDTIPMFLSYEVKATLTDSKGETHETNYVFSVGNQSFLFDIQIPQTQMQNDSALAKILAYTANGQETIVQGTYTLYSLSETNRPLVHGNFISGDELSPDFFHQFPAGRYRLEVQASDLNGRKISSFKDFILYTRKDKRPPVFMHTWLIKERTSCLPGEDAQFIFGTSDKDAYVLYEIFSFDEKCTKRKLLRFNNENQKFRIPFKETDGEGFTVSFTFIKNGDLYTEQIPIYRQQPNQELHIHTETFRDHLLPGSQENWKFRITNAASIAVRSEVLASMYDASLDKIQHFRWYFSPRKNVTQINAQFSKGNTFRKSMKLDMYHPKPLNVPEYQYDQLKWNLFGNSNQIFTNRQNVKTAYANVMFQAARTDASLAKEQNDHPSNSIQIRENFAETAFFYPALMTNQQGEVSFGFTVPESNTTWKLQLLAQTTDLKYGYLSKEVISNKPLMVTSNFPRFLREGDEVTFSAQISNHSPKTMQGETSLELFDPNTNKTILQFASSQQPFILTTDSTTTVSWSFHVPTIPNGILGCRILAKADHGSDGEQLLLPVLSNQLLITTSTPFYLSNENKKNILLNPDKNIRPFRTTLELTANPIWYAVQALPTLSQPENENVISWFASYYGNILASHIIATYPRIQRIIQQWQIQGGDASTLYSSLEKNTELKTILLQETPWVLAAENETEQKQRLALLFNLNRATYQRNTAFDHLLKLQTEEGGWSWFKGMPTQIDLTLYILKGMSQLTQLQAIEYNQLEKEIQIKALNFLDSQLQKAYKMLNKEKQTNKVQPWIIDYLFVRSGYHDIPIGGDAQEAIHFYSNLVKQQWSDQSLYAKGEIAWIMLRNGEKEQADQILNWLRKTATTTPQKGMYWANNRVNDRTLISPISTHCLLMELFHAVSPNTQECNQMKQWLLNQKQTQQWESTPGTIQAIYTLLLTGDNWLIENNCTVQWGDQTYNTASGELATGYLQVSRTSEKAKTLLHNTLTITKEGTAPAWGSVYEQYFQPIRQIKNHQTDLRIEKKLFVEISIENEKQLHPITSNHPLQVGDKVITRLVIHSNREMNYVVLKDLRAGCLEPANQHSGSTYKDSVWCYQSPTDISENFFFDRLPQGTYTIEYATYVSQSGTYANGISTIQCLYAPEFIAHTEGGEIQVIP